MAIRYWEGGTANPNQTNWATTTNWSADTVPVNDDIIIFDGRGSTVSGSEGTIYDCLANIARGDTGGDTYDLIHVKATYTGNIGTMWEPLHCAADMVIFEGTGNMYLEVSAADNETDSDIDQVIMNTGSGSLFLSSDVNSGADTAEITEVLAVQGTLRIRRRCNVANLRISPVNDSASNVVVTIDPECQDAKASTFMNIYMHNGTLTCDSKINTFEMHNGTTTFTRELETIAFSQVADTHEPVVGDTLTGATSGATGTIVGIEVLGGTGWASADMYGFIYLDSVVGAFQDEQGQDGDATNVGWLLSECGFDSGAVEPTFEQAIRETGDTGRATHFFHVLTSGDYTANDAAGFYYMNVTAGDFDNNVNIRDNATDTDDLGDVNEATTERADTLALADLDIIALRLHGGTFNWNPDEDLAFIQDMWAFGGTLDASSATVNNLHTRRLGTAATDELYMFAGSTLKLGNGYGVVDTDTAQLHYFGGTLNFGPNTTINVAYHEKPVT
ncbi:hypothetical protein CL622_01650 [archaeon]|nr:hypothetical protein [archaeon]